MDELKTLAGKLFDLDDSYVVRCNADGKIESKLRITGRRLYCKKCIKPEQNGGVQLTEKSRRDLPVVAVLAIGTGCGKRYQITSEEKKIPWMMKQSTTRVEVGEQILLPDEDYFGGIQRSPYSEDEFFVHECLADLAIKE